MVDRHIGQIATGMGKDDGGISGGSEWLVRMGGARRTGGDAPVEKGMGAMGHVP